MTAPETQIAAALDRLAPAGPLGAAVSGGSDSTALLIGALRWAGDRPLEAATVDHRLRPESAEEAADVARLCADLGARHATLQWTEAPGRGNLQAAAREARHRLLAHWAHSRGLSAMLLGHTLDDQAETVLLRLARGSGVDGLAGMAERTAIGGVVWLRPMLGLRREALRAWLRSEGIGWRDDPLNEDTRFDRVRARSALAALTPLGLGAEGLAATASRLATQRRVLERAGEALIAIAVTGPEEGPLRVWLEPLRAAEADTVFRVLAHCLITLSGAPYRPRQAALERLWAAVEAPDFRGATLSGCLVRPAGPDTIEVRRER